MHKTAFEKKLANNKNEKVRFRFKSFDTKLYNTCSVLVVITANKNIKKQEFLCTFWYAWAFFFGRSPNCFRYNLYSLIVSEDLFVCVDLFMNHYC